MSLQTFNFPNHGNPVVEYPDDQQRLQLGRGYEFATKPLNPIQRTFKLTLTGIQWFEDGSGNVEATISPERNAKALEDFYIAHRLHGEFLYPRPGYATPIRVRFKRPLVLPAVEGNQGVVPPFEVEFTEVVV